MSATTSFESLAGDGLQVACSLVSLKRLPQTSALDRSRVLYIAKPGAFEGRCFSLKALLRWVRGVLLLAIAASTTASWAFKGDTHIWIGQQVINDLTDDGNITVKLKGQAVTLPVKPAVRDAILNNRDAYMLGNLGPDVLPDVLVGQVVVHPGNPSGWKTNDWLRHLLVKSQGNVEGTALAYGYLSHAAADVFAHTYVNQYAGDIFGLLDETLVEQRHAALEAFISGHLPPLVNASGAPLGLAWQQVRMSDTLAAFTRGALIYDDQAANQYRLATAGKHLAAYTTYRNKLDTAANSQVWRDIDTAVAQLVAKYYGYNVSAAEAGALVDFTNSVLARINGSGGVVDLTQDEINRINAAVTRYDAAHFKALNDVLSSVSSLNSRLISKVAERARAWDPCRIPEQICLPHPLFPWKCIRWEDKPCPSDVLTLLVRLDGEITGLRSQLQASLNQLQQQATVARTASLSLAQRIVDLGQVLGSNTSPPKAILTEWRNNVDIAMAGYLKAATQSMVNTLNPAIAGSGTAFLDPWQAWFDCYHLTLVAVPAAVGTGDCGFKGDFKRLIDALNNIANIVDDATNLATYVGPISPAAIRQAVAQIKVDAVAELKSAALESLEKLLPSEIREFVGVLKVSDMTDAQLNQYFTKDQPAAQSKKLVKLADAASRVGAEMYRTSIGGGKYRLDPNRFATLYDAVVLAKLSLLDNAGLNQLAQAAGVPMNAAGRPLFDPLVAGNDNVVANAFASIDGNHQWLLVAPPRPGTSGPYFAAAAPVGYGRLGYRSAGGLVLWNEPKARDALFRSLFIGPLSPGIESPEEIGLAQVLRADYPYRSCRSQPFPNDVSDRVCQVGKVLPVLMDLLLAD